MRKPKKLTPPDPKAGCQPIYYRVVSNCVENYREDKEWGNWRTIYESKLVAVSRNSGLLPEYSYGKAKVPIETYQADFLYLVCVTYSDGDTFGNSSGNMSVAYITESPDEALKIKGAIDAQSESYESEKPDPFWDEWPEHAKSVSSYCEWNGYFCGVESVEIVFLPVMG